MTTYKLYLKTKELETELKRLRERENSLRAEHNFLKKRYNIMMYYFQKRNCMSEDEMSNLNDFIRDLAYRQL